MNYAVIVDFGLVLRQRLVGVDEHLVKLFGVASVPCIYLRLDLLLNPAVGQRSPFALKLMDDEQAIDQRLKNRKLHFPNLGLELVSRKGLPHLRLLRRR